MVFEHQDYRVFLKAALSEKSKAQNGQSIRAFAQRIKVSNSFLYEVLGGKKSLSMELAFKIAVKLNLTEKETQYFCLLVQLEQEKDPDFREEISRRLGALNPKRKTYDLSVDLFRVISDWYHYAILELSYLPDFRLDPAYVCKKLGITKVDAELAIERLKRLELVEKDEKGRYRKTHGYVLAQSSVPNSALNQYHKQLLQKAIESIDVQAPKERVSTTSILPIDSKYLPEVDRLSDEFTSAVIRLAEKSKVRDGVYALAVHLFNLTNQKERNL